MPLTEAEKQKIFEAEKLKKQMTGKSPLVSIILSFIMPGLGDMYCGSWLKAIIFFVFDFISFILMFAMGIGIFLFVPVWICGLISAWMSANKSEKKMINKVERSLNK